MLKLKSISKLIFIALILNSANISAQNLIVNSSFENISSCPDGDGQLEKVMNWINPTMGTPDLYNSCSTVWNGVLSVPSNGVGYQNEGFGGVSYVGLYTYANQDSNLTTNVREYIQSQIMTPLQSCYIYDVSFYVSLADSFKYATNSIGAYLSDTQITKTDYYCFSEYEPQVNSPKSQMLDEKIEWVKISGKFVALGGEEFITIGNFNLDDEIDTLSTRTILQFGFSSSYYYVDNVSLTQFADASMPANAGQDAGIAVGDSIFIGQEISNLNCTWTELTGGIIATNTSGLYVKPIVTTTYIVEQNLCGTITTDTVQIFVHGVGLQEFEFESGVLVYPNPSSGSFSIETDEPLLRVDLIDELGRKLELNWIDSKNFTYSSDLATGVYTVAIQTVNGRISNKKISVQDH